MRERDRRGEGNKQLVKSLTSRTNRDGWYEVYAAGVSLHILFYLCRVHINWFIEINLYVRLNQRWLIVCHLHILQRTILNV